MHYKNKKTEVCERSRRRKNKRTGVPVRKVRRQNKTGSVANRNEGRELHRRFFIRGREE